MARSTIIIIDDHTILRETLAESLGNVKGFQVVGHWSCTEEALDFIQSNNVDLAILDYALPGIDGIASSVKIRDLQPAAKTMILSMFCDIRLVLDALAKGVLGYFPKETGIKDFIQARESHARESLTGQELEVLSYVSDGLSNKEIAEKSALSLDMVKFRLKEIFLKLGAKDRAHAVCIAMRRKLIDASSGEFDATLRG